MTPPSRCIPLSPSKFSLFLALLFLFASSSLAIDLSRGFGKSKDKNGEQLPSTMSSEDALANAKKLVNDLNDASTGTVTSYQPGREKEPVTCNEIMAKSLVVANEEKTAVVAEKDAVVRAATLLAEKIDDLAAQLAVATGEIAKLEQTLVDQAADFEGEMYARGESVAEEMAEMGLRFEEEQSGNAEKMTALIGVSTRAAEEAEKRLTDIKAGHEVQLAAVKKDASRQNREAQQMVLAEKELSRLNMGTLENATAVSIAKIQQEADDVLAAKDRFVAEAVEAANLQIMRTEANAQDRIAELQNAADDEIKKNMENAGNEQEKMVDHFTKQVADMKDDAIQERNRVNAAMAENTKLHKQAMADLKSLHADRVRGVEELMVKNVEEVKDEMAKTVRQASAKLSEAQEEKRTLDGKLQNKISEAQDTQQSLRGDLEQQRGTSFKLEKEVSFWKDNYESQGYCNTTLIKEDSRKIIMNALSGASRGLDGGHKTLMAGLSTQLELVQNTGADVLQFIEKDLLPNIERIIGEGCDKAVAMYDKHLSAAVNENLLPLYNNHIYPVYNQKFLPVYLQHVSPVVNTIGGEATVAIQKSQEGVHIARSKAASLVKETSSKTLYLMEEKNIDKKLPGWLNELITHCATDGEWAVGMLSKVLITLIIIFFRPTIMRIVGVVFSLVWFFCPLRLFVGGRQNTAEKNATGDSTRSTTNGKGKVY